MRLRESGMPEESFWETLFDVNLILDRLEIDKRVGEVVELDCGYGTFTLPRWLRPQSCITNAARVAKPDGNLPHGQETPHQSQPRPSILCLCASE